MFAQILILVNYEIAWDSNILITAGECADAGTVTWSSETNVCNGTSYQSCMPEWDGIVHFKVIIINE